MSKNKQKNLSEINLGNETYDRGFNDGLNGRPKTIKKTHRHAHRYHIGYRAGERERTTTMQAALAVDDNGIQTRVYTGTPEPQAPVKDLIANLGKPKGFWARFRDWLLG